MAPIGDAVGFINHHQAGVQPCHGPKDEALAVQPLRRDQQEIHLSLSDLGFDLLPVVQVF